VRLDTATLMCIFIGLNNCDKRKIHNFILVEIQRQLCLDFHVVLKET
jgi:hypothetical protein